MTTNLGAITVPPGGGHSFDFGGLGVQWKIDGRLTDSAPCWVTRSSSRILRRGLCRRFGVTFPSL